jgi:nicotinate-nucleotide adenylyltransferase
VSGARGSGADRSEPDGVRRLGIMGGTFDPIHLGHLVTAEQVRADLGLDEIVFVPAGNPWQKTREVTSAEDRYLMVVLATAPNRCFSVSRMEIDATGPTYTVDTLRQLRAALPDVALFFITGADAILSILTWRDAEECLALATFVAATRPGHDLSALQSTGLVERVQRVDVPALAISSTDVRQRFAAGRPVTYLIPQPVEEYVGKHGLYGTPASDLGVDSRLHGGHERA